MKQIDSTSRDIYLGHRRSIDESTLTWTPGPNPEYWKANDCQAELETVYQLSVYVGTIPNCKISAKSVLEFNAWYISSLKTFQEFDKEVISEHGERWHKASAEL